MADPQSVSMFAAAGAATGAFLIAVWRQLRKTATMPSITPDSTIPPGQFVYDRDYGRRLDDLRAEFEDHVRKAEPMMSEFAVLKSRVSEHDNRISEGEGRVVKAIADSEGRLDRRLAGIEAWMRRP